MLLVANMFEHEINKVVDHDWRGSPQWSELVSALYVSPALLVELDCVGFAANLLASLRRPCVPRESLAHNDLPRRNARVPRGEPGPSCQGDE